MILKEILLQKDKIYESLDSFGMNFFYLNFCQLISRANIKGAVVEQNKNSIYINITGNKSSILLPLTTDKKLFFEDVKKYLIKDGLLFHIPFFIIKNFVKVASITTLQKEHIVETKRLINMPGKLLEKRRYEKNRFLKGKNGEFEIVELSKENEELFIECNRLWYKRQTELGDKWRLSGKREIEWSIGNYQDMKDLGLNIKTIGFLQDGEIKCFVTGCQLTNKYWVCQTQRRSDLKYSGLGYFMWSKLGEYFSDFEFENDGTSDTKGIYASKYPFTKGIKTSYVLRLK